MTESPQFQWISISQKREATWRRCFAKTDLAFELELKKWRRHFSGQPTIPSFWGQGFRIEMDGSLTPQAVDMGTLRVSDLVGDGGETRRTTRGLKAWLDSTENRDPIRTATEVRNRWPEWAEFHPWDKENPFRQEDPRETAEKLYQEHGIPLSWLQCEPEFKKGCGE